MLLLVTGKTVSATCRSGSVQNAVRQQLQQPVKSSNFSALVQQQRVFILRLSENSRPHNTLRLFRSQQRKSPTNDVAELSEEAQAARFSEIRVKSQQPRPPPKSEASEEALHATSMRKYTQWKTLGKPLIFTVGTTFVAFTGAAIWRYEESEPVQQMMRERLRAAYRKKDYSKRYDIRDRIVHGWSFLSPAEKTLISLMVVNVAVYGAWLTLPAGFMARYFISSTYQAPFSLPLLLSSFSQKNFLHLCCNMYVLWNFGPLLLTLPNMDKQNTLAFYLSAGVVSAYASHWLRIVRRIPSSSLGASGAICAVLAAISMTHPNTYVSIIGLPQYPFSIENGLKAMVALEVVGIWRKWKFFDHGGHLAGLLFGIFYAWRGHRWVEKYQNFVISQWIKIFHGGTPKI